MFSELHPNIRIRIYTSFLSRVVGSMIFPFMAIYFTAAFNAAIAGTLLIIQVALQFAASLYGGYLADTVGRKRLMVFGECMKLTGFLIMLAANSPVWTSAWATFAAMLIIGIASALINPAAEAMLIDVSTKETRAFMYAINYWAVNLSIMLGLMIGGWFYESHFSGLLLGLIAVSFVTLWMTAAFIQDTYHIESGTSGGFGLKPVLHSYRAVASDLPFVLFTCGGIAILSLEFQRNNFIAVRLEEEIAPQVFQFVSFQTEIDGIKLLSLLTVENTLLVVLFTAMAAKWIKGKPEKPIMYTGFILFGVGFSVLAFSTNFTLLGISVLVLTIGELLYVPTRQSMLADIIDESKRGAYMAFNGFVYQAGHLLGAAGLILGSKIGGTGMAVVYLFLMLLGICFSAAAIRLHKNRKKTVSSVSSRLANPN